MNKSFDEITVLMSVYAGERPDFLRASLDSLVNQSARFFELVLVQDGPLDPGHHSVINDFRQLLNICDVVLAVNQGLAKALNAGLTKVRTSWVMRFDTDDVALPFRVEKQGNLIRTGNYDLIGAQIAEFFESPAYCVQSRKVPCSAKEIRSFANSRNPFNHMTVCFDVNKIRDAGGYPNLRFFEDYALWLKMISCGARVGNTSDVLVFARVGAGMFKRRGGLDYIKCEAAFQRYAVSVGTKKSWMALFHFLLRSSIYALPQNVRIFIYKRWLRH